MLTRREKVSLMSFMILINSLNANAESVDLDLVVSATGNLQKITQAPASISVINQEEILNKQAVDIASLLEGVDGIDVRTGSGFTGGFNIVIRGMPQDYVLILVDGKRQAPSGNITPNGYNSMNNSFLPPVSSIDRIEIIKGSMSTLYGSDAMGGVVNIITKKNTAKTTGVINAQYISNQNHNFGDQRQIDGFISTPLVKDKISTSFKFRTFQRDKTTVYWEDGSKAEGKGIQPPKANNNALGVNVDYKINDKNSLSLGFDSGTQKYENNDAAYDGGNWGIGADIKYAKKQGSIEHNLKLNNGYLSTQLITDDIEYTGRTMTLNKKTVDRDLKSKIYEIKSTLGVSIGKHSLSTGFSHANKKLTDGILLTTSDQKQLERKDNSIFIEDEFNISNATSVTLGARDEYSSGFGHHIAPRAYTVHRLNKNFTVKGGISTGYKIPDMKNTFEGVTGTTGGRGNTNPTAVVGNKNLKPETSVNFETALYFNSNNFDASITAFLNNFKDRIASTSTVDCKVDSSNLCDISNNYTKFISSLNIDKAKTYGLEVAGKLILDKHWQLNANYTNTQSKQLSGDNKGLKLTNVPEHLAGFGVNYLFNNNLTTFVKGKYIGARERFPTSKPENLTGDNKLIYDTSNKIKAYALFDAGLNYNLSSNFSVGMQVLNLFNKNFLKGAEIDGSDGRIFVPSFSQSGQVTQGTIEEDRRFMLNMSYSF